MKIMNTNKPISLRTAFALSLMFALGATAFAESPSVEHVQPTVTAPEGQETPAPSPQEVNKELNQQVGRVNKNDDSFYSDELKFNIEKTYGLKVKCETKWFEDHKAECVQGLQTLNESLKAIDASTSGFLKSFTLSIGNAGQWQELTATDQHVVVPFHATQEDLTAFLNRQVSILYYSSPAQITKLNKDLEDKIKDKYFFTVSSAPGLQVAKYHSGLEKLRYALADIYSKSSPSAEDAKTYAFDRIVIGEKNKDVYADGGELRINLNADDVSAAMELKLISTVEAPKYTADDHLVSENSSLTWSEVQNFRAAQKSVKDSEAWLSENLPSTIKVRCVLDSDEKHSISEQECQRGLATLVKTYEDYKLKTNEKAIQYENVLVGSIFGTSTSDQVRYMKAVVVDYKTKEADFYKDLVTK